MKSKFPLVLVLLCAAGSAGAQDMQALTQKGLDLIQSTTLPNKKFDAAYVLQPARKWTVTLEGTGIRIGADLHSDLQVTDLSEDNPQIYKGTMDTGMRSHLYKKIGIGIAYGGLGISYGVELGRNKEEKNKYFSLGSAGTFYGARIQYYKTHAYVEGTLDFENSAPISLTSNHPCQARDLTMDAFYAFNKRKFVYSAAHVGKIVQRRSVGSWMVAAKYLQGDFSFNPADDLLTSLLNGLNRYSARQLQLGGGYSYNWVLLHRNPENLKTCVGLQNLTVNATFLPMVSLFNHIYTEQSGGPRTRYVGQPVISPTIRCALGYARDRWHFHVLAGYNRFGFHGADTDIQENGGLLRSKVRTRGVFYDLTAQVTASVRL